MRCRCPLQHCVNITCSGHGNCTNWDWGTFRCICYDGWTGMFCDVETSGPCVRALLNRIPTEATVCKNGGVCVDRSDKADFECDCATGYSGKYCEYLFFQVCWNQTTTSNPWNLLPLFFIPITHYILDTGLLNVSGIVDCDLSLHLSCVDDLQI